MRESTSVTIAGAKTDLVFGARYRVELGQAELRDAELLRREANGDLRFLEHDADVEREVRIRPSKVVSITGSGTSPEEAVAEEGRLEGEYAEDLGPIIPDRLDDESGSAYLARLERTLGSDYTRWLGTETGQAALESVAREDRAARKAVRNGLGDILAGQATGAEVTAKARAALGIKAPTPRKGARPYAERNQVWRCGTCKRRTRLPVCTGPVGATHKPVSAPAGKRREDRVAGTA